jgi:O-methyltransferase
VQISDLPRAGAKRAQWWLRTDRRLERILRRGRLSGPQTIYSHELVVPMSSTYAPWYDDLEFRSTYDAIKGASFVDQYKCYELWEQLGQLSSVPGDILEVGVWRGGTGVLMARRAQLKGLDARVFLADTFAGVAKAGAEDPWYRGGEHADTSPEMVTELAVRMGVDVELLVGMFPDETSDRVADVRLRLVHIDVDVYNSARDTLEWAWPRLSVGGVVIFDDYGSFECEGVATLGRELFDADLAGGRLVHNLNGHLMLYKLSDDPLPAFGGAK